MVFIYSTILRYLAQIIKGNKRLCYKEVISYSITKKLHIYGMNTIHMQSYHRLDKYKIGNLTGLY